MRGLVKQVTKIACLLAYTMGMLPCILSAPAIAEETRQYKIEAAYLYNFFNYITWPNQASPTALTQAVICVYDDDSLEPYLAYVQQKMVAERKLGIRMLHSGDAAKGCNVLFTHIIDNNFKASLAPDILTISDKEGYIEHGGMIELAQENGRIGMKINHTLLQANGFNVSSRLLSLAQGVE